MVEKEIYKMKLLECYTSISVVNIKGLANKKKLHFNTFFCIKLKLNCENWSHQFNYKLSTDQKGIGVGNRRG